MSKILVRNPRTGQYDYSIEPPSEESLDRICQDLKRAQQEWCEQPVAYRVQVLSRWADAIEKRSDEIAQALTIDTGRSRMSKEAPGNVVSGIRGWCEQAEESLVSDAGQSSLFPSVQFETNLHPYPLVAVISPWNFPFLLATVDAIPALLAGCAVIIKPSEITPRFIEPVMRTVEDVEGLSKVLQFVYGAAETGKRMITNSDLVVFTGSVPTGKRIAKAAAENFIPAFLELGGKDPVVVTKCADLNRAAAAIVRAAISASGQICYSIERVYVDETVHDEFVDALEQELRQLDINYPDISSGHVGPIIFLDQAQIIRAHLADASAKGAKVITGGEVEELGGGLWLRPTLITHVTHDMLVMTEETFGPIIPVQSFATESEAVELANDTEFGLSAAVIAGTVEKAASIGRRLNAGAVSLMDAGLTNTIVRDAEKNSFGCSGIGGSRVGPASILRFVRKKSLITNHGEVQSMAELGEAGDPKVMY